MPILQQTKKLHSFLFNLTFYKQRLWKKTMIFSAIFNYIIRLLKICIKLEILNKFPNLNLSHCIEFF